MNNINIKNIFSNNSTSSFHPQENKINISDFSVKTLIESNSFKENISDDYIINKIKLTKKNELVKTTNLYEIKYKECLIKINDAVELNLTDTIFSVGITYFGYNNYNPNSCLLYIQTKLKNKNFFTSIISQKDIFISWKHINDS